MDDVKWCDSMLCRDAGEQTPPPPFPCPNVVDSRAKQRPVARITFLAQREHMNVVTASQTFYQP
jgi:hypothetical protein